MTASALSPDGKVNYAQALAVEVRVIGAVMLREVHTRFGRNNVGYLWLVIEPLVLACGIGLVHFFESVKLIYGFEPVQFFCSGYVAYIVFRNNVNRSVGTIESNKPLLFHKVVTLFDIVTARCLLDVIATICTMAIVLTMLTLLGVSPVPEEPYKILFALFLMGWLSYGLAMIIAGGVEFSQLIERFVHPFTYLMMPFSGMFYVLDHTPRQFATIAQWLIVPQITDYVREGLHSDFHSSYFNPLLVILVNVILTLIGLCVLKVTRSRMHFD